MAPRNSHLQNSIPVLSLILTIAAGTIFSVKGQTYTAQPFLAKIRQIVYTKHFDMGGSHYAYTEAQSDGEGEKSFIPGSALCLITIDNNLVASSTDLLTSAQGVIRDPDVSYDGRKILFSWKKALDTDDYHLYEMDVTSRAIRQLTSGAGFADYEGCYLPNGNIVFNSTRCVQIVDCFWPEVSNLYLMDGNGNYMRRIGYDQVHTNYPQVLSDGTVSYTRWDYNDRGQYCTQGLFHMFPDGTHQTEYYGNSDWLPTSILHARGIPGTPKAVAILAGHHTPQHGKLAIIDPSIGREGISGVQLIAPVRAIQDNGCEDLYGQDGDQWCYPYPLDENNYLVSFRPAGSARFGIYLMNRDAQRVLLAQDAQTSCNQPVPLAARQKQPVLASTVDYRKSTGVFTIENIYYGQSLTGVAKGAIKRLRVVKLMWRASGVGGPGQNGGPAGGAQVSTPVGVNDASWDAKAILGEADVYADGSAAFEVPARTPVYFQAIDTNGYVAQTMRSWSTLQPGETFSCVGCHEDKNQAVPPMPTSIATQTGAKPLKPFYNTPDTGFSYAKIIQPIFNAKCISCHANQNGIDLRGNLVSADVYYAPDFSLGKSWPQSYFSLVYNKRTLDGQAVTTRNVNWLSPQSSPELIPPYAAGSSKSPLMKRLKTGCHGATVTKEEFEKIAAWIDLLVPGSGTYTEGMSSSGIQRYSLRLAKRKRMEDEEKANIQKLIAASSLVSGENTRPWVRAPGSGLMALRTGAGRNVTIVAAPGFRAGVTISIYALSGRIIKTIPMNSNTALWDGTDNSGHRCSSGLFVFKAAGGAQVAARLQ